MPILPTYNALKILSRAGYIDFIEEMDTQSRVMVNAKKEELYDIKTTTQGSDQVLQAILRLYTGLFADYVFINEDVISMRTGLSLQTIYDSLIELSRMHIIQYIPRKRTPYIYYSTSREESRHLIFPKEIYELQKKRMADRVESIIEYITDNDECRETKLLRYFGEETAHACGHCDVCIESNKRKQYTFNDVRDGILYMVKIRPRTLKDFLATLSFNKESVVEMLRFLVDEGILLYDANSDTYKTNRP